jgi:hypothetical protein
LREHALLLDELRVLVLAEVAPDRLAEESSRSAQVSFARTVREHCPNVRRVKIPIGPTTLIGLLARCAVYRLPNSQRAAFLAGTNPTILCRYDSKVETSEPRFRERYVIPHHRAVTFRFFAAVPRPSPASIRTAPGVFIPCTSSHKLTVVGASAVRAEDLAALATVPWTLLGYGGVKDWFELRPDDRLTTLGAV